MNTNNLEAINNAITHAKNLIELLANPNYPYADFEDRDLEKMFYDLNSMCLVLYDKAAQAGDA